MSEYIFGGYFVIDGETINSVFDFDDVAPQVGIADVTVERGRSGIWAQADPVTASVKLIDTTNSWIYNRIEEATQLDVYYKFIDSLSGYLLFKGFIDSVKTRREVLSIRGGHIEATIVELTAHDPLADLDNITHCGPDPGGAWPETTHGLREGQIRDALGDHPLITGIKFPQSESLHLDDKHCEMDASSSLGEVIRWYFTGAGTFPVFYPNDGRILPAPYSRELPIIRLSSITTYGSHVVTLTPDDSGILAHAIDARMIEVVGGWARSYEPQAGIDQVNITYTNPSGDSQTYSETTNRTRTTGAMRKLSLRSDFVTATSAGALAAKIRDILNSSNDLWELPTLRRRYLQYAKFVLNNNTGLQYSQTDYGNPFVGLGTPATSYFLGIEPNEHLSHFYIPYSQTLKISPEYDGFATETNYAPISSSTESITVGEIADTDDNTLGDVGTGITLFDIEIVQLGLDQ